MMKVVTQYVDSGDATKAKAQLRAAGIMADIAIIDPHFIQPSKSGAVRIELWVEFDDQFEDAVQLLQNPDHIPKRIITLEEMEKIESSKSYRKHKTLPQPKKTSPSIVIKLIVGVCLLGLIAFLLDIF